MPKKKALLLGSYGQTNLGDDVLMWNYLELLRAKGYTHITVNASHAGLVPASVRETFPGVEIVETYQTSLLDWIRILRQVDCAVYGGGTIYKELYAATGRSKHGVTMRMAVLNVLARLLGVKIYHLNIGIGSIKTRLGRWIAKIGLGTAAYSIFRDHKSYQFANERLHLPQKRLCDATDGLFLNRRWEKTWRQKNLTVGKKHRKQIVGVNLLSDIPDWVNRKRYIAQARKLIRQLLDDGHYVLLIPFQHDVNPNNDHVFMEKEIVPHLGERKNWQLLPKVEITEITSVLQSCDVLIGMRFHSLLLATACATPFVAITYDTKCSRFIDEAGYPHSVALEDFTAGAVLEHLAAAHKEKRAITKQLHDIAGKQYHIAEECLRTLQF